jgi:hypothetical protein
MADARHEKYHRCPTCKKYRLLLAGHCMSCWKRHQGGTLPVGPCLQCGAATRLEAWSRVQLRSQ